MHRYASVRTRAWCRGAAGAVLLAAVGGTSCAVSVARWEHPFRSLAALAQGGRFVGPGDGVRQLRRNDCGPAALAHCLRRLGTPVPYPDPDSTIRLGPRGCGFDQLVREARRHGWAAVHRRAAPRRLGDLTPPAILYFRRGHFVVYEGTDRRGRVLVHDPALGRVSFSLRAVQRLWTGDVLEFGAGEESQLVPTRGSARIPWGTAHPPIPGLEP